MQQNKLNSPVVRTSLVLILAFVIREIFNFKMDNEVIDAILIILFATYQTYATLNNPDRKDKF